MVWVKEKAKKVIKRVMNYIFSKSVFKSFFSYYFLKCCSETNIIIGSISKCELFSPGAFYLHGWFLPRSNYDSLEVYNGSKFIGNAELGTTRRDVLRNYPCFKDPKGGFELFLEDISKIDADKPITVILKKKGVKITKRVSNVNGISVQDSLEELKLFSKRKNQKDVIIVPGLSNRIALVSGLAKELPEYDFTFFAEGMELSLDAVLQTCQKKYKLTANDLKQINIFMAPKIFLRNQYPRLKAVSVGESEKKIVYEKKFLFEALENEKGKYLDMDGEYAIFYIFQVYNYFNKVVEILDPKLVLLWNKFYPFHSIIDGICKERNIAVIYYESGVLPGTYAFETHGQMGESYPSQFYKDFSMQKVESSDLEKANEIWQYLKGSKLNHRYAAANIDYKMEVSSKLKKDRPTIFYAGQNDFESGLFPYVESSKAYHSPSFTSSYHAMRFLAKLARKNNWNLIYKRHPMMLPFEKIGEYPSNVISSDKIDIHDVIDLADLTITILSQVSYVSLIQETPALMLGYHQLRGKECCYEAYEKDLIEQEIKRALDAGFTDVQKDSFLRHIAQLNKYYLFDDFINKKDITYERAIGDCADFFRNVLDEKKIKRGIS